jgi:DNA repair protein RadC
MDDGAAAEADYNLLEPTLFLAFPRADTKPIAKALINQFGSFAEAVSASPSELLQLKGIGHAGVVALKTISAEAERLTRDVEHA